MSQDDSDLARGGGRFEMGNTAPYASDPTRATTPGKRNAAMSKLPSDEGTNLQTDLDRIESGATSSREDTALSSAAEDTASDDSIKQRDMWLRKAWGPTPIDNRQSG